MSHAQTAKSIEQAALQLEPAARAQLARSLAESVETLSKKQLDELWLDEAERRNREMESGGVKGIPGETVLSEIIAKHNE